LIYKLLKSFTLLFILVPTLGKAQVSHSFGASIKAGTLLSFNKSVSRNLLGFEKNANAYYRMEPKNSIFGIHCIAGFTIKNYSFPFELNEVGLLHKSVNLGLMGLVKLKSTGALFMLGFTTNFLTYSHTEIHSTATNYYFGNDYLNSLQHSNKAQIDVCLEADQAIGEKQKFSIGFNISQNVNNIIKADFIYPYRDGNNVLSNLTVSKNIRPLSLALVLKYKIK
jgi:hypothetical protein